MNIVLPTIGHNLDLLEGLRKLIESDTVLSAASLHSEDISGLHVRNFSANEVRFEKVTFTEARLDKTGFSDIELLNCDLIASAMPEASWRRVLVQDSRCSGMQLQTSALRDITFSNCKLDVANFRFSKFKNVRFKDCILDEADFYAAELENVDFQNCRMDMASFSGAKLKGVDFRSSDITGIVGINGLAGGIIDSMQLITLAPLLAATLKIVVADS
jgi:uncharacterized protein YjbI with pentapeptide repeats